MSRIVKCCKLVKAAVRHPSLVAKGVRYIKKNGIKNFLAKLASSGRQAGRAAQDMPSWEKKIVFSFGGKKCVDIGGPSSIFFPIYDMADTVDIVNFAMNNIWGKLKSGYYYKDRLVGKVIENDATDLRSISDGSYDVVLSSNNLEHIANPMKAVKEMVRVMRLGGGIVYTRALQGLHIRPQKECRCV